MTDSTNSRRIGLMAQRRGSALLLAVPVIALSLFLVGCPKRPATTAAPDRLAKPFRRRALDRALALDDAVAGRAVDHAQRHAARAE
jgi:hypothetical protein